MVLLAASNALDWQMVHKFSLYYDCPRRKFVVKVGYILIMHTTSSCFHCTEKKEAYQRDQLSPPSCRENGRSF